MAANNLLMACCDQIYDALRQRAVRERFSMFPGILPHLLFPSSPPSLSDRRVSGQPSLTVASFHGLGAVPVAGGALPLTAVAATEFYSSRKGMALVVVSMAAIPSGCL